VTEEDLKRLLEITPKELPRRSKIMADLDRLHTLELRVAEIRARIERLEAAANRPS
jgi:hypothetical protein